MVKCFIGEYEFLSNFYPAKILYGGIEYYNAESAYQAQKCSDAELCKAFSSCYSDEAKRDIAVDEYNPGKGVIDPE